MLRCRKKTRIRSMKITKAFCFFVVALCLGCAPDLIPPPDNLIKEKKMIRIQTDLSLMQAIQDQHRGTVRSDSLFGLSYILKKYKVDSLQLVSSETYYAQNPKKYAWIYRHVQRNLELKLDSINRVIQKMPKE